ncbi:DUF5710 domain-containing protein [Alphaproteobacteria bacterium LSUCC0744]
MKFGAQILIVDVVQNQHANLDSFPFRYGIHFSKTTALKLFDCSNYEWEIYERKFKVTASFIGNDGKIERGSFVLFITDFPNPRVGTIIREDTKTEFFLSELLRSLRVNGKVSTNDFLDWHPLYLSGEANTFEKLSLLYAAKSKHPISAETADLIAEAKSQASDSYETLLEEKEREIARLKLEKENAEGIAEEMFEIYESTERELDVTNKKLLETETEKNKIKTIAEKAVLGLHERNSTITKQKAELAKKNAEIEVFNARLIKLAQQHPQYDGSKVEISTVGLLERVEKRKRVKSNGEEVACVFLQFAAGLPERKMDEVFDPQDLIFEKAKKLVGEQVVTITWRPEIFRSTHWFRDIFLWDENLPKGTSHSSTNQIADPVSGTYLNCPFNDKDECKSLGGKWDPNMKKWFVPYGVDTTPFKKWL